MRTLVIASFVLTLSAGVAFADDLHQFLPFASTPNPNVNPLLGTGAPGQTGSNAIASCGPTVGYNSIGSVSPGPQSPPKSNSGANSPFNPGAPAKHYAGNTGNPATNPKAVSQYDNACAQASLHAGFMP